MDECDPNKKDAYMGPYKATRLWNDVITAFRHYLPTGRHRRYMKTFENCFSGSSAIDWLLQYLQTNNNFGSDVSRLKAVSLLNKLYKAGIFEEVQVSRSMRHKQEAQENRLYRFSTLTPSKLKTPRLPLAPRNDAGVNHLSLKESKAPVFQDKPSKSENNNQETEPLKKQTHKLARKISFKKDKPPPKKEAENFPPCHLVKRVLTTREIKDTWTAIFSHRLRKALGVTTLEDIISADSIDGYNVMHNCIYLNKSGIVTNVELKDQLPHWVMSAMKCLARWPEPPEPGLPNYPGFEKDVFHVVKDYFLGLEEPLIPYSLYKMFITVFVLCGSGVSQQSSSWSGENTTAPSLWTSASLENIILNLTKKYCLLDSVDQPPNTRSYEDLRQSNTKEGLHFVDHNEPRLTDYNPNHFPSTDGMDQLGTWSHQKANPFLSEQPYSLGTQKTHSALPVLSSCTAPVALSRTTQSAGEITAYRNRFLSNGAKRFDSLPDLKVSRYETAFGPDNRTVTRIYYQNDGSTDFGLDRADGNHTRSQVFETGGITSKQFPSSECENKANTPLLTNSVMRPSLGRSKSFADVNITPSNCNRFHQQGHAPSKMRMKHNVSFSDSLRRRDKPDSVGCGNRLDSKHHSCSSLFNTSYREATGKHEDLMNMAAYDGASSRSYMKAGETCTGVNRNSGYYERNALSHYNSNLRSRTRTASSWNIDSSFASGVRVVSEPLDHLVTADKELFPLPGGNVQVGYHGYGPGYRPVLDASKERSSLHNDDQLSKPSTFDESAHYTTSTPLSPSNQHSFMIRNQRRPPSLEFDNFTPFLGSNQRDASISHGNTFFNFPQTRLSEERTKTSLQLVTLLIPPANRRKLHLLFKMMVKMTSNPNLCLDPTQTTRSLVLGTFYSAILRCEEDSDLDEVVILQLVSFILDFYADIFAPPADMKTQVSDRLKVLQRPQVIYSPQPVARFCQQTTLSDFENQQKSASQSALEELLEGIITDNSMSNKEKKRRLKQFQKTYPAIYTRRFPTPDAEAVVLPPKPKVKQPLIVKPLNKLRGLRL